MRSIVLMRNTALSLVGAIGFVGMMASVSYAGSFSGTYTFNRSSIKAQITSDPTSLSQNLEFSDFISPAGFGYIDSDSNYQADNWTNSSTAVATQYFQFAIQPLNNYKLNLDRFEFRSKRGGKGPTKWQIDTSVGNTAFSTLFSGSWSGTSTQEFVESINTTLLQNVTQKVTFRLFAYAAAGTQGNNSLDIWNVTVKGTANPIITTSGTSGPTPVPTPAVVPAIVGFGASLWRKRRLG